MKIIQKFNALSILLTFCATIGVSSVVSTSRADETAPQEFGGVYPRNAFFNDENECGTGAVVAWANRLWAITYGPHLPNGSSDKLYEIDDDLNVTIRPESVGGTNANRMIHRESNQLFIGNHVIDAEGGIRTIPHAVAPGRVTAVARGLKDAANKVYWLTMEEGLYEIDVNTLEAREIYKDGNSDRGEGGDVLPGYHGKGGYTSQGRVVYANNGEQSAAAQQDPTGRRKKAVHRGYDVGRDLRRVDGRGAVVDARVGRKVRNSRSSGRRGMAAVSHAEGVALLRRGARLEHGMAAHSQNRRRGNVPCDDARAILAISEELFA